MLKHYLCRRAFTGGAYGGKFNDYARSFWVSVRRKFWMHPTRVKTIAPLLCTGGEGENETKTGGKETRTTWRSITCAEAPPPL